MKKRKRFLRLAVFTGCMCTEVWLGNVCRQPVLLNQTYVLAEENAASDKEDGSEKKAVKERQEEIETYLAVVEDIVSWKKKETNSNQNLLSGKNLTQAAQSDLDWYALAMARIGYEDEYEAYADAMKQNIAALYEREEKIDANQATIWHRLILTLLALGEDPAKLTGNDGNKINLVADGIYDRGKTVSLGEQGLNGYIWGLIALDSMRYAVPEGAFDTRNSILTAILNAQNEDGGFGLSGTVSDVDITAMAVQALAPYDLYAGEMRKEQQQETTEENENMSSHSAFDEVDAALYPKIEEAVDQALLYLQAHQLKNGAMGSGGQAALESTAQTIVALSALKIDAKTEESFIRDGHTLLDGLMSFQCADGSFRHLSDDEEGNSLSSGQAAYALTAYVRVLYHSNSLYDMRPEKTAVGTLEKEEQMFLADYGQLEKEEQIKTKKNRGIIFIIVGAAGTAAGAGCFVGMKKRRDKKVRMEEEWDDECKDECKDE